MPWQRSPTMVRLGATRSPPTAETAGLIPIPGHALRCPSTSLRPSQNKFLRGDPIPRRDADAVFACTTAMMRRYLGSNAVPSRDGVEHLVRFCMTGVGVDWPLTMCDAHAVEWRSTAETETTHSLLGVSPT